MGQQNRISRDIRRRTGANRVLDENLNFVADPNEKQLYFEISDFGLHDLFFENPH